MFKLFQTLFEVTSSGVEQYPDWLIDKATERAVDGLDPRLRLLSSYKKKLRPSITHAIDHVVTLVDELASPIDASRKQYSHDLYLSAFFATANELQQYFSHERSIWDYLDKLDRKPEHLIGLLMMDRTERGVFGVEMEGDILRRDVPRTTVSFAAHQLLEPTGQEDETRRLLKHRAFDHLIQLALRNLTASQAQRLTLEQQTKLLRRKLATFEKAGLGFDVGAVEIARDQVAIQQELDEVEIQLKALPAKTELLNAHLDILINVFNHAQQKLWSEPVSLIIDRLNIKRDSASGDARELLLSEFHSENGLIKNGALVSYPTAELLPRKKFLSDKSPIYS